MFNSGRFVFISKDYVVSVKKKEFTLLNIFIHKKMKVNNVPDDVPVENTFYGVMYCIRIKMFSRDCLKRL